MLLTYAVRVLTEPDALTDADIDELHGHGWSDRVLAAVVGLVALNQLTGSFSLVAGLAPMTSAPVQPDPPCMRYPPMVCWSDTNQEEM